MAFWDGVRVSCHCTRIERKLPLSIPKIIDDEFRELNPQLLRSKVKGSRRRQHCNPMKATLMKPLSVPDWREYFCDPALPLTVDIGSGQGKFSLLLAKKNAGIGNYLGLDVRQTLVEKSNIWAEELDLDNVHFLTANATVSFGSLLPTYPGRLDLVCIMCPDPHFKLRHRKRRIVQQNLVEDIVKYIAEGGRIFLESDIEEVALDMRSQFDKQLDHLTRAGGESHEQDTNGWLLENPLQVHSEREIAVLAQSGKMFRVVYKRTAHKRSTTNC